MVRIITNLQKWAQTLKICWSNLLTYRVNFLLQVLGPTFVFFFIKYNLWSTIFNHKSDIVIQGYHLPEMLEYHLWGLLISLWATGHNSMNLAEDIRLGRISNYLIYPFNFWEYHSANFLAFQVLQLGIGLITFTLFLYGDFYHQLSLIPFFKGLVYCQLVGIFWFGVQYMLGLMAFWLEETWILRVIFQMITSFLSGAVIPLEFYPKWLTQILDYTPFPYLGYYPIKIFMGDSHLMLKGIFALCLWMLPVFLLNRLIWKKGMRLYTAAGM